jgi:hypothetical protein
MEGNGYPAIFCHVRATYLGDMVTDPKTPPSGMDLEGDGGGRYYATEGDWTVLQMDSAFTPQGSWSPDKYCIDMNDSIFTRGFQVDYYFKARDLDGFWTTEPATAESYGAYKEWTALPTLNSDILYVDDYHGVPLRTGGWVNDYWDPIFSAVLPTVEHPYGPDRFDTNNPSSGLGNGIGAMAKTAQLIAAYNKIIWDSGPMENMTICDGDPATTDQSNDCQLLIDWLNLSEHDVGLWVCGDGVAHDIDYNMVTTQALDLMSNWCGVVHVAESFYQQSGGDLSGGITQPFVTTVAGVNWTNPIHVDSFVVDGGCNVIDDLDCLGITAESQYALRYPDYCTNETPAGDCLEWGDVMYAGVQNEKTNAGGYAVKTMWFGFTLGRVGDDPSTLPLPPGVAPVGNRIADRVIFWLGNTTNDDITVTDVPRAYKLAQNFPNPFNPSTTIMFDMREKGHMTLKIYNVAGQLIRTLVNDVKDAGSHKVTWDGKNNLGVGVASGVYFYKMETTSYSQTKKMVMLR